MYLAKTFIWTLAFVSLTGMSYTQPGWVQTQLNASMGHSLYATDTEIYAATQEGVYSTIDNGMPWFSKGPADYNVYDIIKSHQYLLAAAYDGVHRSSDNGNTWLPTNGLSNCFGVGGTHGPHTFAKNSAYVFVLGVNAGVAGIFRSGDDGANWQQMWVGQDAVGQQDYAAAATCICTVGENIFIGHEFNNPPPSQYIPLLIMAIPGLVLNLGAATAINPCVSIMITENCLLVDLRAYT